jgi:hypothetical protein
MYLIFWSSGYLQPREEFVCRTGRTSTDSKQAARFATAREAYVFAADLLLWNWRVGRADSELVDTLKNVNLVSLTWSRNNRA